MPVADTEPVLDTLELADAVSLGVADTEPVGDDEEEAVPVRLLLPDGVPVRLLVEDGVGVLEPVAVVLGVAGAEPVPLLDGVFEGVMEPVGVLDGVRDGVGASVERPTTTIESNRIVPAEP